MYTLFVCFFFCSEVLTLIQIEKTCSSTMMMKVYFKEDNGSLPFKYLHQSGDQHVFVFYIQGVILHIFSSKY